MPKPSTARVGGRPLRDLELLTWCRELVDAVLLDRAGARAPAAAAGGDARPATTEGP